METMAKKPLSTSSSSSSSTPSFSSLSSSSSSSSSSSNLMQCAVKSRFCIDKQLTTLPNHGACIDQQLTTAPPSHIVPIDKQLTTMSNREAYTDQQLTTAPPSHRVPIDEGPTTMSNHGVSIEQQLTTAPSHRVPIDRQLTINIPSSPDPISSPAGIPVNRVIRSLPSDGVSPGKKTVSFEFIGHVPDTAFKQFVHQMTQAVRLPGADPSDDVTNPPFKLQDPPKSKRSRIGGAAGSVSSMSPQPQIRSPYHLHHHQQHQQHIQQQQWTLPSTTPQPFIQKPRGSNPGNFPDASPTDHPHSPVHLVSRTALTPNVQSPRELFPLVRDEYSNPDYSPSSHDTRQPTTISQNTHPLLHTHNDGHVQLQKQCQNPNQNDGQIHNIKPTHDSNNFQCDPQTPLKDGRSLKGHNSERLLSPFAKHHRENKNMNLTNHTILSPHKRTSYPTTDTNSPTPSHNAPQDIPHIPRLHPHPSSSPFKTNPHSNNTHPHNSQTNHSSPSRCNNDVEFYPQCNVYKPTPSSSSNQQHPHTSQDKLYFPSKSAPESTHNISSIPNHVKHSLQLSPHRVNHLYPASSVSPQPFSYQGLTSNQHYVTTCDQHSQSNEPSPAMTSSPSSNTPRKRNLPDAKPPTNEAMSPEYCHIQNNTREQQHMYQYNIPNQQHMHQQSKPEHLIYQDNTPEQPIHQQITREQRHMNQHNTPEYTIYEVNTPEHLTHQNSKWEQQHMYQENLPEHPMHKLNTPVNLIYQQIHQHNTRKQHSHQHRLSPFQHANTTDDSYDSKPTHPSPMPVTHLKHNRLTSHSPFKLQGHHSPNTNPKSPSQTNHYQYQTDTKRSLQSIEKHHAQGASESASNSPKRRKQNDVVFQFSNTKFSPSLNLHDSKLGHHPPQLPKVSSPVVNQSNTGYQFHPNNSNTPQKHSRTNTPQKNPARNNFPKYETDDSIFVYPDWVSEQGRGQDEVDGEEDAMEYEEDGQSDDEYYNTRLYQPGTGQNQHSTHLYQSNTGQNQHITHHNLWAAVERFGISPNTPEQSHHYTSPPIHRNRSHINRLQRDQHNQPSPIKQHDYRSNYSRFEDDQELYGHSPQPSIHTGSQNGLRRDESYEHVRVREGGEIGRTGGRVGRDGGQIERAGGQIGRERGQIWGDGGHIEREVGQIGRQQYPRYYNDVDIRNDSQQYNQHHHQQQQLNSHHHQSHRHHHHHHYEPQQHQQQQQQSPFIPHGRLDSPAYSPTHKANVMRNPFGGRTYPSSHNSNNNSYNYNNKRPVVVEPEAILDTGDDEIVLDDEDDDERTTNGRMTRRPGAKDKGEERRLPPYDNNNNNCHVPPKVTTKASTDAIFIHPDDLPDSSMSCDDEDSFNCDDDVNYYDVDDDDKDDASRGDCIPSNQINLSTSRLTPSRWCLDETDGVHKPKIRAADFSPTPSQHTRHTSPYTNSHNHVTICQTPNTKPILSKKTFPLTNHCDKNFTESVRLEKDEFLRQNNIHHFTNHRAPTPRQLNTFSSAQSPSHSILWNNNNNNNDFPPKDSKGSIISSDEIDSRKQQQSCSPKLSGISAAPSSLPYRRPATPNGQHANQVTNSPGKLDPHRKGRFCQTIDTIEICNSSEETNSNTVTMSTDKQHSKTANVMRVSSPGTIGSRNMSGGQPVFSCWDPSSAKEVKALNRKDNEDELPPLKPDRVYGYRPQTVGLSKDNNVEIQAGNDNVNVDVFDDHDDDYGGDEVDGFGDDNKDNNDKSRAKSSSDKKENNDETDICVYETKKDKIGGDVTVVHCVIDKDSKIRRSTTTRSGAHRSVSKAKDVVVGVMEDGGVIGTSGSTNDECFTRHPNSPGEEEEEASCVVRLEPTPVGAEDIDSFDFESDAMNQGRERRRQQSCCVGMESVQETSGCRGDKSGYGLHTSMMSEAGDDQPQSLTSRDVDCLEHVILHTSPSPTHALTHSLSSPTHTAKHHSSSPTHVKIHTHFSPTHSNSPPTQASTHSHSPPTQAPKHSHSPPTQAPTHSHSPPAHIQTPSRESPSVYIGPYDSSTKTSPANMQRWKTKVSLDAEASRANQHSSSSISIEKFSYVSRDSKKQLSSPLINTGSPQGRSPIERNQRRAGGNTHSSSSSSSSSPKPLHRPWLNCAGRQSVENNNNINNNNNNTMGAQKLMTSDNKAYPKSSMQHASCVTSRGASHTIYRDDLNLSEKAHCSKSNCPSTRQAHNIPQTHTSNQGTNPTRNTSPPHPTNTTNSSSSSSSSSEHTLFTSSQSTRSYNFFGPHQREHKRRSDGDSTLRLSHPAYPSPPPSPPRQPSSTPSSSSTPSTTTTSSDPPVDQTHPSSEQFHTASPRIITSSTSCIRSLLRKQTPTHNKHHSKSKLFNQSEPRTDYISSSPSHSALPSQYHRKPMTSSPFQGQGHAGPSTPRTTKGHSAVTRLDFGGSPSARFPILADEGAMRTPTTRGDNTPDQKGETSRGECLDRQAGSSCKTPTRKRKAKDQVDVHIEVRDVLAEERHNLSTRVQDIRQDLLHRDCQCAKAEREILVSAVKLFGSSLDLDLSSSDDTSEIRHNHHVIGESLDLVTAIRALCSHGRRVSDVTLGSVVLRMRCPTLTSLYDLCDMHKTGRLQTTLSAIFNFERIAASSRGLSLRVTLEKRSLRGCERFLLSKVLPIRPLSTRHATPNIRRTPEIRIVRSTENLLSTPMMVSPSIGVHERSLSTPLLPIKSPLTSPLPCRSPLSTNNSSGTGFRTRERKFSFGETTLTRIAFQELNLSDAESPISPCLSASSLKEDTPLYALSDAPRTKLLVGSSPILTSWIRPSPSTSPRRLKRCDVIREQENMDH